ncbi:MAG: mechanosensitive ion channel family protein [bacterium]
MEIILRKIQELFAMFGLKILAAIVILVLGRWAAKLIRNISQKIMKKSKIDATIVSFVGNLLYVILLIFVILAALGQLGIQTTSLIAIIGAAGLAVGLALQGSLANFAAGILMIIFRPFKVGDFIEGAGVSGIVEEIQIFTTKLKTLDNKIVIIPNAKLTDDNIMNYSAKEIRRVDLVFGVSYSDDIDKVRKVILEVLSKDERILQDPGPTVGVVELADSSVNFAVRPWVKTPDYWNVYFDVTENVKKAFDAQNISIPFPQQDVHLYKKDKLETAQTSDA